MMIDDETKASIAKRRDKAIAVILRAKEDECDSYLPPDVRAKFRKTILDQVNEYHEMTMEILKFSLGTAAINDEFVDRLVDQMDQTLREVRSETMKIALVGGHLNEILAGTPIVERVDESG